MHSTAAAKKPSNTEALVSQLLMKDHEEMLRRKQGKGLVGAPLHSIPETPSFYEADDVVSVTGMQSPVTVKPPTHHKAQRSEGGSSSALLASAHGRSLSISSGHGTAHSQVATTPSSQTAPHQKEKAFRFMGPHNMIGGFAAAGSYSSQHEDVNPFRHPNRVARSLVARGHALARLLETRTHDPTIKARIRVWLA